MSEVRVRVLGEDDWQDYRRVRLAALHDSPSAFTSRYEQEVEHDEAHWRTLMTRAQRLLAERDETPVGVVSLRREPGEDNTADLYGLWVRPEDRNTGVAWRLVEAVAEQAIRDGYRQLYYWVGTDNGRAIGFATNFGFRPTSRRRTAQAHDRFSDGEVALVLPLLHDPRSGLDNPFRPRLVGRPGPAGDEDR